MVLGARYARGGKPRVGHGVAGGTIKAGNFIVQAAGGDGKWDEVADEGVLIGGYSLCDAVDGENISFIVVDPELEITLTLKSQTTPAATGGPSDKRQVGTAFTLDTDSDGYDVVDLDDTGHDVFRYEGYKEVYRYDNTLKALQRVYVGIVKVLPACCQTEVAV